MQKELAKLQLKTPAAMAIDAGKLTVAQYLDQWLRTDAKQRCRGRTWEDYQRYVENEINPRIGGVALSKLTPMQIKLLLAEMEEEGKSAFVRFAARKVLNRALNCAVKAEFITKNPCALVEAVRLPHRPMTILGPEEVGRFLDAARSDRLHALYVLAISSGMRQGEIFGMQWQDVDLDNRLVTVQRSLDRQTGLSDTKTPKARRPIDLPDSAVAALREHRERMLAEGHGNGFVFCDTDGGPLRQPNVLRRSFRPLLERAQVPAIRFHDLMHSHASLLLLLGANPKVVQERLGHAQVEMTLEIYSHLLPGLQRAAADRLDDLLRAGTPPKPDGGGDAPSTKPATQPAEVRDIASGRLPKKPGSDPSRIVPFRRRAQ